MTECMGLGEVLSAWLDGEADPAEEALVTTHLERCDACRARVVLLRELDTAVAQPPVPPSPALEAAIRMHARAWHARPLSWARRVSAAALVLIAAALLLILPSPDADAGRMVEQAAVVDALLEQDLRDQADLLKTFEWELRALNLEAASLAAQSDQVSALAGRIEALLRQVEAAQGADVTEGDSR